MCAQFVLKINADQISKKFGIKISNDIDFNISPRGFLKTDLAPIIIFENNKLIIKESCFSLCPSWSKDFPCNFTTYNARLERVNSKTKKTEYIYQVPTWKDSFNSGKTCLIPMQKAIESSYFGTHAGNMIGFKLKNDEVYYALGIFNEWVNKSTGEIHNTFALLTDDPYAFFFKSGHDRSIFLIDDSKINQWLEDSQMKPQDRFNFLRNNRIDKNWEVEIERPLKEGWQKRAPSADEIYAIKTFRV